MATANRVPVVSCGHGVRNRVLVRASHLGRLQSAEALSRWHRIYGNDVHNIPGLDFVQGDAENLPFPDESFDVVLNVEASHAYPHFDRFLSEVQRVLRPGGHFLSTDFRDRDEFSAWEAALAGMPMRTVSEREISAEVLRGLDNNSPRYRDLTGRPLPMVLRPLGRRFAGLPGTLLYRELQRGNVSYRMYHFIKD